MLINKFELLHWNCRCDRSKRFFCRYFVKWELFYIVPLLIQILDGQRASKDWRLNKWMCFNNGIFSPQWPHCFQAVKVVIQHRNHINPRRVEQILLLNKNLFVQPCIHPLTKPSIHTEPLSSYNCTGAVPTCTFFSCCSTVKSFRIVPTKVFTVFIKKSKKKSKFSPATLRSCSVMWNWNSSSHFTSLTCHIIKSYFK